MTVDGSNSRIHVFLAAENRLLREALARVLSKKSDIRVVAAVAISGELCSQIAETQPRVLLLDATAFTDADMTIITHALRSVPTLRVIMVGMSTDDKSTFLQCVRAGVTGFVLMDASAAEVATAVRSVAAEKAVCPPILCSVLFDYVARQDPSRMSLDETTVELTRREQQLAQMIGSGLSNKEIAARLSISDQTVKNHVHHMLRKLGASDRLHAVRVCKQHGLV